MWILLKSKIDDYMENKSLDKSSSNSIEKSSSKYVTSKMRNSISMFDSLIDSIEMLIGMIFQRINQTIHLIFKIFFPVKIICQLIFNTFYFFYITIPYLIWSYIWTQVFKTLIVFCRRNPNARKFIIHLSEIIKLANKIYIKARQATTLELLKLIAHTIADILHSWWCPPPSTTSTKSPSISELSELLVYEEILTQQQQQQQQQIDYKKARRSMHHHIPFNPFKATIKLHHRSNVPTTTPICISTNTNIKSPFMSTSHSGVGSVMQSMYTYTSHANTLLKSSNKYLSSIPSVLLNMLSTTTKSTSNTNEEEYSHANTENSIKNHMNITSSSIHSTTTYDLNFDTELSDSYLEQYAILHEADTPASFPPTPFSRAHIMNRSAEHVSSVMFAARDKLRQEAQSVSTDHFSRQYAQDALYHGYMAIFDPKKSSENILLSCGNHCIMKIGNSFCSTSQSMIPLITGVYVYFEFSMTVCNDQIPSLALGLSPPDCPLNVMVGSWPRSIAINTEGQLLVGSQWFPPQQSHTIKPGNTVGFLIYIPDESSAVHSDGTRGSHGTQAFQKVDSYGTLSTLNSAYDDEQKLNIAVRSALSTSLKPILNPTTNTMTTTSAVYHTSTMPTGTLVEEENTMETQGSQLNETDVLQTTISSKASTFSIQINIDGHLCQYPSKAYETTIMDIQTFQTPLYPTVCLLSENTRVWCRFCEADIVSRSRIAIGAPPNTRVYCVDGSLLLSETD